MRARGSARRRRRGRKTSASFAPRTKISQIKKPSYKMRTSRYPSDTPPRSSSEILREDDDLIALLERERLRLGRRDGQFTVRPQDADGELVPLPRAFAQRPPRHQGPRHPPSCPSPPNRSASLRPSRARRWRGARRTDPRASGSPPPATAPERSSLMMTSGPRCPAPILPMSSTMLRAVVDVATMCGSPSPGGRRRRWRASGASSPARWRPPPPCPARGRA